MEYGPYYIIIISINNLFHVIKQLASEFKNGNNF